MSGNDVVQLSPAFAAQNKGPVILGVVCSITALATLFVAARFYVKGWIKKKFSADDWVILVSLIFGWLAVAFTIAAVRSGDGRHMTVLSTDQKSGAILWTMVGFFPSILSITVPKFAVVSLLIRLLNPSRWHCIFLWCLVTISGLGLCGCMVILWSQCTPTRSQWDFSIPKSEVTCWDIWILIHYSETASSFAGLVDLYLAIYPGTVLVSLQLGWKKKLSLSVALGAGVIAAVTAFYKATTLKGLSSPDFTWDTCDLTMWTCIEGGTIIIAACIPLLQPILDKVLGGISISGSKPSNAKYYKQDDSKQRGERSGTELSTIITIGGSGAAKHYSNRRLGKSDPDASILATRDGEASSQESILERGGQNKERAGATTMPPHPSHPRKLSTQETAGGIIRTQDITVEYGNDGQVPQMQHQHSLYANQWKAGLVPSLVKRDT
ncbi:hypothetical protein V494_03967 [Pseudogymnoascus sp. VKM F-4513 (FW-928)]|nr:hypothetical protein V494_03967 [Pseudogymnoascus sp. VKM F-4513 (FW-928)]